MSCMTEDHLFLRQFCDWTCIGPVLKLYPKANTMPMACLFFIETDLLPVSGPGI
jgi:hypothetical protein